MRKILETPERSIYADGGTIIKIGPSEELDWEVRILETISRVRGVPHILGFTASMGGCRRTLVMDALPGSSPKVPLDGVLPQILNILVSIYEAGVVHMRVTPENILYGDGMISLVGFSKAALLESNPMAMFPKSPDMIGKIDSSFKIRGPLAVPQGGFSSLSKSVSK